MLKIIMKFSELTEALQRGKLEKHTKIYQG